MKVRTTRKHTNSYAPQFVKNPGRIYEPTDRDASYLIAAELVEPLETEVEPDEAVGQD